MARRSGGSSGNAGNASAAAIGRGRGRGGAGGAAFAVAGARCTSVLGAGGFARLHASASDDATAATITTRVGLVRMVTSGTHPYEKLSKEILSRVL